MLVTATLIGNELVCYVAVLVAIMYSVTFDSWSSCDEMRSTEHRLVHMYSNGYSITVNFDLPCAFRLDSYLFTEHGVCSYVDCHGVPLC